MTAALRLPSARLAPGSPGAALPTGAPLPAAPVDTPGHEASALAGRGLGEVPVRAVPGPAGAMVVDLRLIPPPLVPHGELQRPPWGYCCGQAVGAPGHARQAPGQAGEVTLRDSRSSPLPRMLFWLGPIAEQALVINVRGFGLVLVSGCGHPAIERMLAVAEMVLDVPVRGVVGGLHLPVHPLGTPLIPQAVFGSPNWPWRPIGERDVAAAIQQITQRGPRLVALSSHDSTPWTYTAFAHAFGDRYRTLRVGERLDIGPPATQTPTADPPA